MLNTQVCLFGFLFILAISMITIPGSFDSDVSNVNESSNINGPYAWADTDEAKKLCEEYEGTLKTLTGSTTEDWCMGITSDVCTEIDGYWQGFPRCNDNGVCLDDNLHSCLIIDQERLEQELQASDLSDQISEVNLICNYICNGNNYNYAILCHDTEET